jgi:hypothetical protein
MLMMGALGPPAPAPPGGRRRRFHVGGGAFRDLQLRHLPGVRRRHFHVDGGRFRTFSSGTSRGSVVDVFTLMVGAPGSRGPAVDILMLIVNAPGHSAPAPLGGPSSTFSR